MASRKRTIKGSARQGTLTRHQAKMAVRAASGKYVSKKPSQR